MKEILRRHLKEYPQMEVRDAVKLLYQSEFGGGHMIADEEESLKRLEREWVETEKGPVRSGPVFEPIGNGLCRMDLKAVKKGLSLNTMNRMFVLTAQKITGTRAGFEAKLDQLLKLAEEGETPFSYEDLASYLKEYKELGYPAVSHSRAYKGLYHPAYRIVSGEYAAYFEIFCGIDGLLDRDGEDPILVAVDGKSGSGKSTAGELIRELYGCNLFHMDDFFLRPEQRTKERFEEAGGNVDYERFYSEVLLHVKAGEDFSYRRYDCCSQQLQAPVHVKAARLNLIEGVYSQHPYFGGIYDLRYFFTISEQEQKERILKRNGPLMLKRFLEEWIPLENAYFVKYGIDKTVLKK